MQPLNRPRLVAVAALCALGVACTDDGSPTLPPGGPTPIDPSSEVRYAALECVANPQEETVACRPQTTPAGASADILYGGQNEFVRLESSSVDYDLPSQKFTVNVTVRNLLLQAIGTTDGVTPEPSGVKVFFTSEPTATGGSGVVAIDNANGTGTFTAVNQPYFSYVTVLDPFEVSGLKTWQFDVPSTVTSFAFVVMISSPVQYPTGWIEVSHPTFNLRRTYEKVVTGTVRDQYGRPITGAEITWSSANPALATVVDSTGVVHGIFPGTVNINATSTNSVLGSPAAVQNGTSVFSIKGTQLVWTAGDATTDWTDPDNWDRGVSPSSEDSVTIPVLGSLIYPVLTANQPVNQVTVADGATVTLNAFDLTASGNVTTGITGGIGSTTGRLVLTGATRTVQGVLPRMRITGTYALTANITARAPLRVELGRLRSQYFRIRVTSQ